MTKYSIIVSLLAALVLAGCGGTPLRESLPTSADRLVAKDFVQIIVQVESLVPARTAVRMAHPIGTQDTFDTALREELRIAGYLIQPITKELLSDVPVVGHSIESTPVDDGKTSVYNVSVGEIVFRRGYSISKDGLVEPITAMEAKGVDTGILAQDDSIFDLNSDTRVASASIQTQPVIESDASSQQVPEPIEEELIVIPPVVDASVTSSDENVLFNTRIVGESLLSFDGDSLILGEANKRRVRNMVSSFRPKTDVFSVLGCVFQDEVSWTEDASQLAADRAQRIQSELLYAGVSAKKIRAEACAQDEDTGAPIIPVGSVLLLLNRSE